MTILSGEIHGMCSILRTMSISPRDNQHVREIPQGTSRSVPSGSGDGVGSSTDIDDDPNPDIIVSAVRITRRFFFLGGDSGVHWKIHGAS